MKPKPKAGDVWLDVNAGCDEHGFEESEVLLLVRRDSKYWHYLITRGSETRWAREHINIVEGWYAGPFDYFKRIA